MENQKENQLNGPGSVQRQTQNNQQFDEGNVERERDNNSEGSGEFGVIPAPQAKGSDADKDRDGEASIDNDDDGLDFGDIDDEKIIPGLRAKQNPWNSITFDSDDFFGGLAPA